MNIPVNKRVPARGNKQCRKSYCACRLNQRIVDKDYLDTLLHCVGIEFVSAMKIMADATMLEKAQNDWFFENEH